jgi:hypothetical protein
MKNKSLIITALLVTSAGAFGLGWTLKPATNTETETSAGSGTTTVTSLTAGGGAIQQSNGDGAAGTNPTSMVDGAFAKYLRNGTISPEDMSAAIKAVVNENDPLKKRALFSQLLSELTPENAVAAYDALRESRRGGRGFGGFGGSDDSRLLLNAWGRVDGAGAVAELQAREKKRREEAEANGEEDSRGGRGGRGFGGRDGGGTFDLYSIVNGWATVDSGGASKFVNTIEDDRQKSMLSSGIVQGLLVNGVDDALAFVSGLPAEDEGRSRHMSTIASEMLEQGVETAAAWVSNIGDDDLQGGAMNRIAESYASEDLEGAVAWVGKHAGNESANRAVSEVAERWAESDPQAVIDWAGNLPETAQAGVYKEALDEWTEKDPLAASEYLSQMPDSAAKNSAIDGFARELAGDDGEAAVTWAQTITDANLRTETLSQVARDWYRQDQNAASEWLITSGLPEETITNIAQPDRGRGDWGGRGGNRGGGRGR